jgi:cytochrome oxidase Cu insertion factor (SCO1/SenC/PrrC family)
MRSFGVALLALLAMAAVAGCGSGTDEAAAPAGTVTESTPPETTRATAPPLSGVTLDGDAVTLGDFLGRPVLINVWSSW